VQLQAATGTCWESSYEAAGVVVNAAGALRARAE